MHPDQALDYAFSAPPAPGTVTEVAPGVHWLRMPLPFALDHINLWLLDDGEGVAIVDCGIGNETTRGLWQQVLDAHLRGRPVTRVIATHCHPDHAGNARWLTDRFGVVLWMSQGDYLMAHAWRDDAAGYTVPRLIAHLRANGLDEERLAAFDERGNQYSRGVPEMTTRYRRIMDGDRIVIGHRPWQVIMGYGHAPEHAALYSPELGIFISGDMVLPRISTNIAVASVDPDADPLKLFLTSLRHYRDMLPADTLVLPSHGLPFRGLHVRIGQLDEHHVLRLAELLEACAAPRSAADVIGVLFRRKLDTHQTFFAMGEALAHLNYLYYEHVLERTIGPDGVVRFVKT